VHEKAHVVFHDELEMREMINTREVAAEYRLSHWAQIVQERSKIGASVRAYCKQIGICENTYFYWQRRLRQAACEELSKYEREQKSITQPSFVEIEVAEPAVLPAKGAPTVPESSPGKLHIKAGGVQITADSTYPPEQLGALLRELRRPW